MARPLRVEYPGTFYHVINRGNAGEKIFKNQRQEGEEIRITSKQIKNIKDTFKWLKTMRP
jgi:hypothetical protein